MPAILTLHATSRPRPARGTASLRIRLRKPRCAARLCSIVSRSRKRFNCTETEEQSMAAYLVYICQSVSDRKELETYWKDMPRTLMGFDIKLHTAYRPFQLLE